MSPAEFRIMQAKVRRAEKIAETVEDLAEAQRMLAKEFRGSGFDYEFAYAQPKKTLLTEAMDDPAMKAQLQAFVVRRTEALQKELQDL